MSYKLFLEKTAQKDLNKLPPLIQKRIVKKLYFFRDQKNPLDFATPLVGNGIAGDYRFRVGDYRIIFDINEAMIVILMIEHRREVYRKK